MLVQPALRRHRGGDNHWDGTAGALTGADDVGVPDISLALTDNEPGHASGISRAQDRPEIAGFFESLSDEIEGYRRARKVCQAPAGLGRHAQDAIGVVAIANFVEHGSGDRLQHNASATSLLQEVCMDGRDGFSEVDSRHRKRVVQGQAQGARPINEQELLPVALAALAQFHQVFDGGIVQAGDDLGHSSQSLLQRASAPLGRTRVPSAWGITISMRVSRPP